VSVADLADRVAAAQQAFPAQEPAPVQGCPLAQPAPAPAPEPEPVPVAVEPPPPKKDEEPKEKTWVEVALVDMEGQPVPGARYRIKLPGEAEPREGTLDDKGRVGFYQIDPGTCKINFPDYDKDAWEPA
jgi:hypothetical protein